MEVNIKDLTDSRDAVNKLLERFGVRFGVYRKGVFNEQLFPFDSVPRIIRTASAKSQGTEHNDDRPQRRES